MPSVTVRAADKDVQNPPLSRTKNPLSSEEVEMRSDYLFVSCDIVSHSAERVLERQVERIAAINRIVGNLITSAPSEQIIWASGGDGGHIAFSPGTEPGLPLRLLIELCLWAKGANVNLRLIGAHGAVEKIRGADGRIQLVGIGINRAGRLLDTGDGSRIVVTDRFRAYAECSKDSRVLFHDLQPISLKSLGPEKVCLMSIAGQITSKWDEPPGISDNALLRRAVTEDRPLDAIYRAKRILQLNPASTEAKRGLWSLTRQSATQFNEPLIGTMMFDEQYGPAVVKAGTLIERLKDETICSSGDEGSTMFLILKGLIGGYLPDSKEHRMPDEQSEPNFLLKPGELAGELAFALQRRRTATLRCLENTAVLAFNYSDLLHEMEENEPQLTLRTMLDRRIFTRILENVWNTAPLFSRLKLAAADWDVKFPWLELQPHSQMITIERGHAQRIGSLASSHLTEGLCLLVSGEFKEKRSGAVVDSEKYPLLWADFEGEAKFDLGEFIVLNPARVLLISRNALSQVGEQAPETIIHSINETSQLKHPPMSTEGLLKIAGCDDPNRKLDVVFVHGLDGDATTTWHPKGDSECFWPRWLAEDIKGVGVWSLGYAVNSTAWKGTAMPLIDRGTNVLDKLELEGLGNRPLVFVCHSLGGLLVKQVLRHANDYGNSDYQRILDQTAGIVFLSTPHSGADIASWLSHIGSLLRLSVSVEELKAHDPQLRGLNNWFRNSPHARRIRTLVYCEKRTVAGLLVVNETSADPGITGVVPIPLDEDHISICKPNTRQAQVYRRVQRLIEDTLASPTVPVTLR